IAGPMFIASSWTSPLGTQFEQGIGATSHELTDNLSILRGSHLFKMGLNGRFTTQASYNQAGIYPNVTFGRASGNVPPESIGPPAGAISAPDRAAFELLYNDLLGRMAQIQQTFYSDLQQFQTAGTARLRDYRTHEYSYFLQDDW